MNSFGSILNSCVILFNNWTTLIFLLFAIISSNNCSLLSMLLLAIIRSSILFIVPSWDVNDLYFLPIISPNAEFLPIKCPVLSNFKSSSTFALANLSNPTRSSVFASPMTLSTTNFFSGVKSKYVCLFLIRSFI